MKQDLEYFIAERAEQLALVYLTRSTVLSIEHLQAERGLNFLVTILQDQLPTGRMFGVRVRGQDKAVKASQSIAASLSSQDRDYFQALPFPACVLLFTMEDDRGYCKWVKHPDQAELAQWHSLETYDINQMIETVNAWYDEKSRSVAELPLRP